MICLCDRQTEGVVVKLWEQDGQVTITVKDERNGENFALEVEPSEALDAYNHPYAYRARAEESGAMARCDANVEYSDSDSEGR